MLVIDPGTLRLPLRSAGEQCPPLHALYSFCIIPKSNPIPQGIFCLGVMFVQLDLSCRRRRRWRWAVPLVLAALLLALPQLAALRPAALARVDRIVGGHYMTPAGRPAAGKFHAASTAGAVCRRAGRERRPCGSLSAAGGASPASPRRGSWPGASAVSRWPARTLRRGMSSSTRAGGTRGVVTRTDGDTCTVEFSAAAGLCGSYAGLSRRGSGS